MEIVKELNLNKNPQGVKNASLVNAWNIKLSSDCSYITADDSIHDVIENHISGNIVGVIPCNKEFVILTSTNNIYRFQEDENGNIDNIIVCITGWHYSGGEIKGTYSYNVNGELIIAIAEDGNNIPLKTINLNKSKSTDNEDQYTPAPNIPIVNMTLVDRVAGTPIPQGLYYFFIRFKCQDETYTNWFPIGVPQYAVAKRPINISLGSNPTAYTGKDVTTTLLNNSKFDCPYGFKFRFTINNNTEYNKAQLGYILQHDNGSFGRKWNEINLENTGNNFELLFDAVNPQEESIESLLENPINLYDVKSITNYENRLYIANFKETNYDVEETNNLKQLASQIQVRQYMSDAERFLIAEAASDPSTPVEPVIQPGEIVSYDYLIKIIDSDGLEHNTVITVDKPQSGQDTIIKLSDYNSNSEISKIRNLIRETIWGGGGTGGARFNVTYLKGTIAQQGYHDLDHTFLEYSGDAPQDELLYIRIPHSLEIAELGTTEKLAFVDSANNDIPCYEFFDNAGQIIQDFDNYETHFLAGNLAQSTPNDNRAGYWICGAVEEEPQDLYFDTIFGYFIRCLDMTITKVAVNTTEEKIVVPDDDTSGDIGSEYRKYNKRIENAVRTLMPNEVYSFYVHYVRADGSYTNGIQLENDVSDSVTIDNLSSGLTANGKEASAIYDNNGFKNLAGLKNCELYTYGIAENVVTYFNLYKNINNKKLFYTCTGYAAKDEGSYKICKIVPIFKNITIPSGYVGVFFSYAKVDPLNIYYAYTRPVLNGEHIVEYKASEVEAGVCTYVGSLYDEIKVSSDGKLPSVITDSNIYISNLPGKQYIETKSYDSNINNKSQFSTFGMEGAIGLNVFSYNKALLGNPSGLNIVNVRKHDNSIYSNENVNLISLGQILYCSGSGNTYGEINSCSLKWDEFNYPSFVVKDKIFLYKYRVFISDDGELYSANVDGSLTKENNLDYSINIIRTDEIIKHSNFNLDCLSIKKEPEYIVKGDASGIQATYYIVRPLNMTDLVQFPNDFLDKQYKGYVINDQKRYVSGNRSSILRRSNILADESLENTLRYFSTTEYKVIPRDKGKITNLIGLGYSFLIHTEHTLYAIDRNNLLKGDTANVQLETPSVFDIDPKEVFTSSHGYGGLQTNSWTANHNGYFFYDRDSIELYNTDNNGLVNLTTPIKKVLAKFNPDDAAFVTDFDNNRIIICFAKTVNSSKVYLTVSYNMLTKSFISLHSYCFNYGYNTKNRPYIRLAGSNKLGTTNTITSTSYKTYRDWANIANGGGVIKVSATTYSGQEVPSIIEIIFNPAFEVVKVLNCITWMIKLISDFDNSLESNMVEEEDYSANGEEVTSLNRVDWYSGEVARIYSDLTDSLDLNIETTSDVNQFNNYKYPYFDRGAWNLNYFRNHYNATNSTLVPSGKSISDNRGLLYGRYFIIRFILGIKSKYKLPFRLNNVDININQY